MHWFCCNIFTTFSSTHSLCTFFLCNHEILSAKQPKLTFLVLAAFERTFLTSLNLVRCHTYTHRWHGTSGPWCVNLWTPGSVMRSYCCGFPSSWPVNSARGMRSPGGRHTSTKKGRKTPTAMESGLKMAARKVRESESQRDREGRVCAFEENISRRHGTQADPLSSLCVEDPSQQMKAGASLRWSPSIIPASCIK